MTPDVQRDLMQRIHAHLAARTTDTSPRGATRLPVEAYLEPSRALFSSEPLVVGHASQLPGPGDFFTHDHAGVPLLVARGDDDRIRAFLNVCRHRGTRVEEAPCGGKKAFVCPYHAWTYGRDGSLLTIPHGERGFAAVDRSRSGLTEVPCTVQAGLVIVHPRLDRDADHLLGELEGFGLATGVTFGAETWHRALSWKLGIDVFLETYHLRATHKDSIYPMFFDNLGLVDPFGRHVRTCFPKRSAREASADSPARLHANILYHLFPNTLVLVEPDHAAVVQVWPTGDGTSTLHAYLVIPEAPATDKARAYWDANRRILYDAVAEDLAMGESIQRGLASGANTHVTFGAFEHALSHFHDQVARASATLPACSRAPTTSPA